MPEFELKDAKLDEYDDPILGCPYIQHEDLFVFYKPNDNSEKIGFKFMSIRITGYIKTKVSEETLCPALSIK